MPTKDRIESDVEAKRSNLKVEIMKVSREFIDKRCDSKGNLKHSNFNSEENEAVESLSNKVDELKAVITTTDKSSKFSIFEPEIYVESMKPHTSQDRKIDKKELKKVVKLMNDNSKCLSRIVGIGKAKNQEKRALANVVVSQYPEIPVLSGADKDHKKCKKNEVKMRPIMNAMVGPKKCLSELYSKILRYIAECQKSDTVCKNTEELLAEFENFNNNNNTNRLSFITWRTKF